MWKDDLGGKKACVLLRLFVGGGGLSISAVNWGSEGKRSGRERKVVSILNMLNLIWT